MEDKTKAYLVLNKSQLKKVMALLKGADDSDCIILRSSAPVQEDGLIPSHSLTATRAGTARTVRVF